MNILYRKILLVMFIFGHSNTHWSALSRYFVDDLCSAICTKEFLCERQSDCTRRDFETCHNYVVIAVLSVCHISNKIYT